MTGCVVDPPDPPFPPESVPTFPFSFALLSPKVGVSIGGGDPPPLFDPLSGAVKELDVSPALANACSISAIFLPVNFAISSKVFLKVSPSKR